MNEYLGINDGNDDGQNIIIPILSFLNYQFLTHLFNIIIAIF